MQQTYQIQMYLHSINYDNYQFLLTVAKKSLQRSSKFAIQTKIIFYSQTNRVSINSWLIPLLSVCSKRQKRKTTHACVPHSHRPCQQAFIYVRQSYAASVIMLIAHALKLINSLHFYTILTVCQHIETVEKQSVVVSRIGVATIHSECIGSRNSNSSSKKSAMPQFTFSFIMGNNTSINGSGIV